MRCHPPWATAKLCVKEMMCQLISDPLGPFAWVNLFLLDGEGRKSQMAAGPRGGNSMEWILEWVSEWVRYNFYSDFLAFWIRISNKKAFHSNILPICFQNSFQNSFQKLLLNCHPAGRRELVSSHLAHSPGGSPKSYQKLAWDHSGAWKIAGLNFGRFKRQKPNRKFVW